MTAPSEKPPITLRPVKSSQIESIGHEDDPLAVKFTRGGLYHYHGVSAAVFEQMLAAESVGRFLEQSIKPNFKFTKR